MAMVASMSVPTEAEAPPDAYVRLGHGVGVLGPADAVLRLTAWTSVLPVESVFTGLTAARVRCWWLPTLPDDLPVFAATQHGRGTSRRAEVRLARCRRVVEVQVVEGLRLASDREIVLACARDLGLLDLVVMLDSVLAAQAELRGPLEELAATARRGAPRLRRALELCDPRAESPWETMLRVLLVVSGHLVRPQHQVLDPSGAPVVRADLWLVGTTTLMEYDGDVHQPRAQQVRDLRRLRRLHRDGGPEWVRHGYTSEDVVGRAVGILRDADDAVGRLHDPARVRAWHDLLRDSARTPAGCERLRLRLGLGPQHQVSRHAES